MSETIVVAVTGEDGNVSHVPLSEYEGASELVASLPDEVVQSHPDWKRLDEVRTSAVNDYKKMRARAQTAEQLLAKQSPSSEGEDPDKGDATTPTPKEKEKPEPVSASLDLDTLRAELKNEILDDIKREREALTAHDMEVKNLMAKHRLHNVPNAREILEASSDMATVAEMLGRSAKQFDEIQGGDIDVEGDEFRDNLLTRLNLPK